MTATGSLQTNARAEDADFAGIPKTGVQPCLYTRPVSAVLMIGLGGRIGGQIENDSSGTDP